MGIGSNGMHHSSFTLYFSLRPFFVYKSLKAAQSSGASEGTLVTIPVPLFMVIVCIGRAYTTSYLVRGALRGSPTNS
jgi:hypothetical protein